MKLWTRLKAAWAWWRRRDARKKADSVARIIAFSTALLALGLLWPPWVVETADPATIETVSTKEEMSGVDGKGRPTSTESETTQTKVTRDNGLATTILNEPGVIVLARLGLIAISAFIAGLAVQRIMLAEFAIKIAGLEVSEIQRKEVSGALAQANSALPAFVSRSSGTVDS